MIVVVGKSDLSRCVPCSTCDVNRTAFDSLGLSLDSTQLKCSECTSYFAEAADYEIKPFWPVVGFPVLLCLYLKCSRCFYLGVS